MNGMRMLVIAVATAVTSGCATMIPDYQRPLLPIAEDWRAVTSFGAADNEAEDEAEAQDRDPLADLVWQDYFLDEGLRGLIAQALEHNRDLRVAALNIENARALYNIRRADLMPGLNAGATQSAQRVPGDLNATGEAAINRQLSANLGVTAYELDFFGRVRSLNEQALAQYFGTEEAYRSARNALVAEVAFAWLSHAGESELHALADVTYQTRQTSLELTQRNFDAGVVSALDLSQAQTSLARARADLARQSLRVMQAGNALDVLVGEAVERTRLPVQIDDAMTALAGIAPNLPSEVLASRPDILAAEQQLRAANANIGAARAAFFPRITLTASAGTASASLDGLFGSGSGAWSFIPQISVPIFDGGRLNANLASAGIQRDIAMNQYEGAIQSAFREVADALAERATLAEQIEAQRNLLAAATENHRLADARYSSGLDSYLGLLDAQRTLYGAEQELIAIRLSDAANRIALYKSLGGGGR